MLQHWAGDPGGSQVLHLFGAWVEYALASLAVDPRISDGTESVHCLGRLPVAGVAYFFCQFFKDRVTRRPRIRTYLVDVSCEQLEQSGAVRHPFDPPPRLDGDYRTHPLCDLQFGACAPRYSGKRVN